MAFKITAKEKRAVLKRREINAAKKKIKVPSKVYKGLKQAFQSYEVFMGEYVSSATDYMDPGDLEALENAVMATDKSIGQIEKIMAKYNHVYV